jgi:diguanylate cyclase (GGDEF)-like protein
MSRNDEPIFQGGDGAEVENKRLLIRLQESQERLREEELRRLDYLRGLRRLLTAVGTVFARGWAPGDMGEVVRAIVARTGGEEEIDPGLLDQFASKIQGHLEVRGLPAQGDGAGASAFKDEGFARFLEESSAMRGARYRDDANELGRLVALNSDLSVFVPLLGSFLMRIIGDTKTERHDLSVRLSAIIRSLLNVEKQFRDFLEKSLGFVGGDSHVFTKELSEHLEQIQEALSNSSPGEHEELLGIISQEVGLISDALSRKVIQDESFLSHLADERSNLKMNLADVTRDYSNFVKHSNQLLNELKVIKAVALRDALTGVFNRRAYDEQIFITLINYKAGKLSNFSLIIFDIDFFRDVNNRHGHQAGDSILVGVSKLMVGTLRSDDFVFRYGGDEFVIILPNADLAAGVKVAEKLRSAIETHKFPIARDSKESIPLTISLGVAVVNPGDNSETIFERADRALYASKQNGRNRVTAIAGNSPTENG